MEKVYLFTNNVDLFAEKVYLFVNNVDIIAENVFIPTNTIRFRTAAVRRLAFVKLLSGEFCRLCSESVHVAELQGIQHAFVEAIIEILAVIL
jgi:hypothetical protein